MSDEPLATTMQLAVVSPVLLALWVVGEGRDVEAVGAVEASLQAARTREVIARARRVSGRRDMGAISVRWGRLFLGGSNCPKTRVAVGSVNSHFVS